MYLLIILLLLTSTAFADIKTGLIGWYKLDDNAASLSVVDSSTSANTGTSAQNTNLMSVDGRRYKALSFNGTTDFIFSASNSGISGDANLTMCAWIYMNGSVVPADYQSFMGTDATSTGAGLSMTMLGGRPAIDFWNNRCRVASALTVKTWYHVCGTKAAGTITANSKIYINGVNTSCSLENADTAPNITNKQFIVGRLHNQVARYFNGYIDDARFYNRVLTASDITELYNMGIEIRNANINNLTTRP